MINLHSIVHYGNDKLVLSLKHLVAQRNPTGASNKTKWSERVSFIRNWDNYKPAYRAKSVNGYISRWDCEWRGHLPYPLVGVEWLDIGTLQTIIETPWGVQKILDHSDVIRGKLNEIGFDYEQRADVIRIWGYLPRDYTDFPPSINYSELNAAPLFRDNWK